MTKKDIELKIKGYQEHLWKSHKRTLQEWGFTKEDIMKEGTTHLDLGKSESIAFYTGVIEGLKLAKE